MVVLQALLLMKMMGFLEVLLMRRMVLLMVE